MTTSTSITATVPRGSVPLDWSLSPKGHAEEAAALIQESENVINPIAKLPDAKCTFDTVIRPLGDLENAHSARENRVTFLQHVSTDVAVRDASVEAEKKLQDYGIETSMRVDLYERVAAARRNTSAEQLAALPAEDQRLFEKMELDFRRSGLALPAEKRDELKTLKKRLADLQVDFSRRMNEDITSIVVSKEELEGMPEDWVSGLTKAEGQEDKYIVTVKYPDLFPVGRLCKVEATRKALITANDNKCGENVATLEEAISLRRSAAKLLGYQDHASFKLEVKMAKSPKAATDFLADLQKRLVPLAKEEVAKLLLLKAEVMKEGGKESDGIFHAWDYQFYTRLQKERESNVDDEKVKEYFSLASVTNGMLDIYQTVLGLRFEKVAHPNVWHEDVSLFEVYDKTNDALIGHFYLDLHPREGKYGHAACFGLRPGCVRLDTDGRDLPSAAMVANFSKPTEGRPSLLKHDEVTTYFHELGHVMHQICSKTKWARFHGTAVERDFVEAPSQMLENWCWDAEILRGLSSHYKTGDPLPKDWVERLVAAKNLNAGLFNLRQIFFGVFDLTVHSMDVEKVDTTKLWSELRESVTLIPNVPGTHPASSFGHIMGGYDAGYYGYLWSQVFSADMFYSRFAKEGVLDPLCGQAYRTNILVPGGSRDGNDMLRDFLGREPTLDAFLRSIGLSKA